jgi:hypothetical protein
MTVFIGYKSVLSKTLKQVTDYWLYSPICHPLRDDHA